MVNDHPIDRRGREADGARPWDGGGLCPTRGFAFSPRKDQKTVLRAAPDCSIPCFLAGSGLRSQSAADVSFFDGTGKTHRKPIFYQNAYVGNGAGPLASRVLPGGPDTSLAVRQHIEVDRQLWSNAVLRVSYIYSQTRDMFVVNPVPGMFGSAGLLGLFHSGRANYHEFETTLHFRPAQHADLNVSYIWSRREAT